MTFLKVFSNIYYHNVIVYTVVINNQQVQDQKLDGFLTIIDNKVLESTRELNNREPTPPTKVAYLPFPGTPRF